MKKYLALILTVLLVFTALVGCSRPSANPDNDGTSTEEQPVLSDVVQKVKDAYGEDYLPSMVIEEAQFVDMYSVNMDQVEEFIAEGPMMSAHVDTFIAIKSKSGKGAEVEKELQKYLEYVVQNSMQYPSNIAKVQSAQVVRHGDYVFYVLLGGYDDRTDATEEEGVKFAKDQIQKGVDAIASCF